ncbi:hypothetical protein Mlaev_02408 [Microbacterium laevaniformans]|uniref:Recombinase family protein n=1 Tax=Microbacterium laevaniformans TaxID=36807 RepID=A0A150HAF3_9MICO|nr:recombinase family protein [Microbacterium laevaniformans]KXZ58975.1 hypothetical protein Mlaev_02408 [Microbacterium laevaniformans]
MVRGITTASRQSAVSTSGHAAIYTRISDDPEGTALGVSRQEQDCRALAERLGLDVVAVFSDNDVSASTASTKDRPAYSDMLARARAGEFTHVLAYSNSRLTRRLRESLDLIDLAKTGRVVIKTVASGEFDLSTADGRATALTLATWDQAEAERVGERVKRAARQRIESGRWHGGVPPFGYRREDKTLVVDERESDLIREAAHRVLDLDDTLYGIVQDWNKRGDLTRKGTTWRHSVLRNILINPATVGTNSAGVENCWVAILDRDTHSRLLSRLAPDSTRRTNSLGVKSSKYPLGGGLVRCGRCGKPLSTVARKSLGTVKMACRAFMNGDHPNHAPDENGDKGRVSIDAKALEQYLYEQCVRHLDDLPYWDRVKREREEATSDLKVMRDELDARKAERDRAGRAFIAGIMSESEAQGEVARLDDEIARLKARIDGTQGGPLAVDVWGERRAVLDRWDEWEPGEKRLFFRDLIESVTVGDWPSGIPTTTLPRKNESSAAFEARREGVARDALNKRIGPKRIKWRA